MVSNYGDVGRRLFRYIPAEGLEAVRRGPKLASIVIISQVVLRAIGRVRSIEVLGEAI